MPDAPGARPAPALRGRIEVRDVRFRYEPDVPVLNGVDLTVEPGQHVAIVGASGSGKSTLFALLLRLYAPSSGAIAIDGHDVRRFTAKSLRDQISVVPQHPVLFHATLWENIAYGRPGAARDEIVRAARLANAHEFIAACRVATTRSWANAARPCPAASASASPSRGPSSGGRRSSCSTSRRPRWIPSPRRSSSTRCRG